MNNLRKVTLFTAPSRRNSKQRSAHAQPAQMLSIRDPGTKRHTSAQSRSVLLDWKAPKEPLIYERSSVHRLVKQTFYDLGNDRISQLRPLDA